jgi:hypothetical protein
MNAQNNRVEISFFISAINVFQWPGGGNRRPVQKIKRLSSLINCLNACRLWLSGPTGEAEKYNILQTRKREISLPGGRNYCQ